jgi:trk system potassium uptake protein TrkH
VDTLALKNIAKVTGFVGVVIALFFGIAIAAGVLAGEAIMPLVRFDVGLLIVSAITLFSLRRHRIDMRIRDAIATVNVIWVLLGLTGAVPFVLATHVTFVDGLFEAVSGYTTTGATIYADIDALPRHILLLRSLMHWLGGMGIIVLGVGLFALINPTGSMALFKAEATGNTLEKLSAKIRDTALRIWGVYVVLTAIDALLLRLEGMDTFDAINHALSTLSTGGFSTRTASMAYWGDSPAILWTTTVFMLLAGINFLAHLRLLRGDGSGYRSEEVRWYLIAFGVLGVALSLEGWEAQGGVSAWTTITQAFFAVASIMTTTGFGVVDYERWGAMAVVIVLVAMLLGGNAGSTAGGFKISRYVVLMKNVALQVRRLLHPKAVTALYVDGNRVGVETLGIITAFAWIFILSNVVLTFYLYARGYDLLTALSAAIATIGNIGPGFGRVGVVENYAFFSATDKLVLSAAMIAGRLEFFTVLLLFSRTYWRRF